jgi:hypothetical protein
VGRVERAPFLHILYNQENLPGGLKWRKNKLCIVESLFLTENRANILKKLVGILGPFFLRNRFLFLLDGFFWCMHLLIRVVLIYYLHGKNW